MTRRQWRAEVAKALILKNKTQLRMAVDLGYTSEYITNVVTGKRKGEPAVHAISKYLGIEDYLGEAR